MKILATTDGSEYSEAALRQLGRLVSGKESEILLMIAIPRPDAGLIGTVGPPYVDYHVLAQQMRTEAQAMLKKGEAVLKEAGFSPRLVFREGDPAEQILQVAREEAVDLIVVGSHGRTGFQRFLLGSVSDKVASHAPCSVVIIKNPKA